LPVKIWIKKEKTLGTPQPTADRKNSLGARATCPHKKNKKEKKMNKRKRKYRRKMKEKLAPVTQVAE